MKKKAMILLNVIVIVAILTIIVTISKRNNYNRNIELIRENTLLREQTKIVINDQKVLLQNLCVKINGDLKLKNSDGVETKMSDFKPDHNVFVFINSFSCENCIKSVLRFINQLVNTNDLQINIIRPFLKIEDLKKFRKEYSIKDPIFSIANGDLGLKAQEYSKAFLFCLDRDLKTVAFFPLEERSEAFRSDMIQWIYRIQVSKSE